MKHWLCPGSRQPCPPSGLSRLAALISPPSGTSLALAVAAAHPCQPEWLYPELCDQALNCPALGFQGRYKLKSGAAHLNLSWPAETFGCDGSGKGSVHLHGRGGPEPPLPPAIFQSLSRNRLHHVCTSTGSCVDARRAQSHTHTRWELAPTALQIPLQVPLSPALPARHRAGPGSCVRLAKPRSAVGKDPVGDRDQEQRQVQPFGFQQLSWGRVEL